MAVGIFANKSDVDFRVGQLAQSVRDNLTGVGNFKLWLDATTDPQLTALGYVAGDIDILRSAVTDLDTLRQVYLGTVAQTPAYDFRTFAKHLA
jgi:hypothetical protein